MSLDEIYLWLEENIPNEYKGDDLVKAINLLSKADVFRGRIYRQQHWRFLVYQNFLLSYGISASKKTIKTGFTSYKRPTRILKIWMVNQRNAIKKEIAKKLARFCHISYKRAMSEFNLLKVIINDENIHNAIGLNEKEIEFLQA
jgi:replication factor C large subunit